MPPGDSLRPTGAGVHEVPLVGTSRLPVVVWCSFLLIAFGTFWPGLKGGFVSDMFGFIDFASTSDLGDVLRRFVPTPDYFYRPLYFAAFWLLYPLFGDSAIFYLLLSFSGHLLSALLLYHISIGLNVGREAAALASLAFLLSLHAHEPVLEVSQIHFSLGSCFFLGAILSHMRRRVALSSLLTLLTLLIFEAGLLILPIAGLYEFLCRGQDPGKLRRMFTTAVLMSVYLVFRYASSDIFREGGGTCQSTRCWSAGLLEYVNRLFVRPDAALEMIWLHRVPIASATCATLFLMVTLLRPWTWRHWGRLLFTFGWLAGSVLYFFVGLWPYISDRFLYIPDMGLALCMAMMAQEVIDGWNRTSPTGRLAAAFVAAVCSLWLFAGAVMIRDRASRWSEAAALADRILDNIYAMRHDLPAGATLCVLGLPDSLIPEIAPGNTGPYVFRNNFPAAVYQRFGRRDFAVTSECSTGTVFSVAPDGSVSPASLR